MASVPKTMRAWQYSSVQGGLEKNLQLRDDVPVPALSTNKNASELLIETIAASINPADYKDPKVHIILKLLAPRRTPTPATPGMDFCGRVIATTPGASTSLFVPALSSAGPSLET